MYASRPGDAHITSVIRRDETILRLGGEGSNFHMSWMQDDRQVVSVNDGTGFFAKPKEVYNNRLYTITGGPRDAQFEDLKGYPEKTIRAGAKFEDLPGLYYGWGTLALDGRIYQFLSALEQGRGWIGAKLIYSPDNGQTWFNHDGSTPVVWEDRQQRSRETMVFLEESQNAFSLLTILQMGRNYEANRDGYIYVYAPNGNTEGTMNELVMFRVPKAELRNRDAYEYFAGIQSGGHARWSRDINVRGIVHTFPSGWVGASPFPYAWHPSVVYNAPLGLYLMANWGRGWTADGTWFGKPCYLGFWVARQPWGPWTQIHEETAWTPGNDPTARAYQPQIAPKWIADDGKSFWLVWTDFQHTPEFIRYLDEAFQATEHTDFIRLIVEARKYRPYYAFNTQRVDLVVA